MKYKNNITTTIDKKPSNALLIKQAKNFFVLISCFKSFIYSQRNKMTLPKIGIIAK